MVERAFGALTLLVHVSQSGEVEVEEEAEVEVEAQAYLEHEAVAGDDEDAVVLAELGALHVLERVVRAICTHAQAHTHAQYS